MSKKEFMKAMGCVDDRILQRYEQEDAKISRQKNIRLRWGAFAACLLLVGGICFYLFPFSHNEIVLTAEEVAAIFDDSVVLGGTTNAYTKVYAPSSDYFKFDTLPTDEYMAVYQYNDPNIEPNKSELKSFVDEHLPRLCAALDCEMPQYVIRKDSETGELKVKRTSENEKYQFVSYQHTNTTFIAVYPTLYNGQIELGGEMVQVDQSQSDEEMIASLSGIKEKLFDIFGVTFTDVSVSRSYGQYSEYGAEYLEVCFYNKDENALSINTGLVYDYISITFDNYANSEYETASKTVLNNVSSIRYQKTRTDLSEVYKVKSMVKRISLAKAEELLYNGYVFSGHACSLCMESQDKIDFKGYDFVKTKYVFGHEGWPPTPTIGVPFYVFYKEIGKAENGNIIYAKTYVPAIEVSGLQAYFEAQKENHKSE